MVYKQHVCICAWCCVCHFRLSSQSLCTTCIVHDTLHSSFDGPIKCKQVHGWTRITNKNNLVSHRSEQMCRCRSSRQPRQSPELQFQFQRPTDRPMCTLIEFQNFICFLSILFAFKISIFLCQRCGKEEFSR